MLLTLLGGCMVTSVWAANLVWVLLGVNWVFEGRWREKWQMARKSRLLQAVATLFLLHVIGLLWTSNLHAGMHALQVSLPLLIVPLVLLTTRPATGRARQIVLFGYVGTVLVVSIIGAVRLLTIPDLPYREAIPYISHIRFALNCCMVVYIGALCIAGRMGNMGRAGKAGLAAITLWLLVFLVLIRSYTAFAILAVVSLALVLTERRQRQRRVGLAAWLLLAGGTAALVAHEAKAYYRLVPQATEPLAYCTAGGRPYAHYRDGIIENGNYINNYLCVDELRAEWPRRSQLPFDSTLADGYTVQPTLVRYLNACGLTKDSVGLWTLTDSQIGDIERGVANPVYASRNPVRKMVYVMLLEREYYVHTHAVRGFTMLQRFELWKATLGVIGDNLWIGVGTGDVGDELHARLQASGSALADSGKGTHNQYLAFLAAFGIAGAALLLAVFLRALLPFALRRSPLMLAWLLTVLISMLTEDTLATLAGILFCTFFLAFRQPSPRPWSGANQGTATNNSQPAK